MTHAGAVARWSNFAYIAMMESLRHLALTVGRAFALLAAVMVALVPVLPAHAHLHQSGERGLHAAVHASHGGGSVERTDLSADAADEAGMPQNPGDCCFVSHVPVIPSASMVPLPSPVARDVVRAGEPELPPDVLSEALPEPPRPFA